MVVEGGAEAAAAAALDAARAGWRVQHLGDPLPGGGQPLMWRVAVSDEGDAARVLDAAIAGQPLLVEATAGRGVVDALCEDLRRLGTLVQRMPDTAPPLSVEEYALVDLLADGHSLGDAAGSLCISRRTADRRLAAVKERLGVSTTAEAVLATRSTVPPPTAGAGAR